MDVGAHKDPATTTDLPPSPSPPAKKAPHKSSQTIADVEEMDPT